MKLSNVEETALQEIVIKVGGRSAVIIVSMLKDKDDVDEFKMAQKAKMTINELRNILYKLHNCDLVSFSRKKDKKKGWFIYYWTLNREKAIRVSIKNYHDELKEQEDILDNIMKKNYFVCPRGHIELSQESSLEQNFECLECGELLILKDRDTEKKRIERIMDKLKIKIKELQEILDRYEAARPKIVEKKKKVKKKPKAKKLFKKQDKKPTKKTKPKQVKKQDKKPAKKKQQPSKKKKKR
ncbi:MAG: hypothetical protein KJ767_03005 [Nanoarchaeota archaeon]|nr:hypothetical protein [Nanoarchaeota archaeon]